MTRGRARGRPLWSRRCLGHFSKSARNGAPPRLFRSMLKNKAALYFVVKVAHLPWASPPRDGNLFTSSLLWFSKLCSQNRPPSLARNNSYPPFELAKQIYIAFDATDRSHPSSDATKSRLMSRELEMALARRKPRRVNAVSIPLACEVCRKEPVTTLGAPVIRARRGLRPRCGMVAKSA